MDMMFVREGKDDKHRLYDEDGKVLGVLDTDPVIIGKKKGEADIIVEDLAISRVHARVYLENGEYYLEDLNSTNGTFKNGMRLRPYEKKQLMDGDEIKLGNRIMIFK